ncbi:alpha/beta hydrolase [Methanobacterium sp. ACI-7]|uniref:alpha/beta hydrolase n=1 Tax=Methanobacterium sp. ACI-7 TaxID=3240853 RepID=UPI0039C442E0
MEIETKINEITYGNTNNEFLDVTLKTDRGDILCRYYKVPNSKLGAIWVGGVGGGFDTPSKDLYPELSKKLMNENISSLRIQYRNPVNMEECIYDVITGIIFLEREGISEIALTGHSLGGAVVIQAAAVSSSIKTVVTLATQSFGTDNVKEFNKGTSILLIHGSEDSILPVSCSRMVYGIAHEPKERVILSGNGHCLEESANEVKKLVYNWILSELK